MIVLHEDHTVKNILKILGCHERDNTTPKLIGKATFTSAKGYAPYKESGKEEHWVGSLLWFYL
jgi:hypothetical protein